MLKDKLHYLLTTRYWFDIQPNITSTTSKITLVVAALLLFFGVFAKIKAGYSQIPAVKDIWQKFVAPCITMGLFLVLWFGARFQQGNIVGSHFMVWCLMVITVLWIIAPIKNYFKNYKPQISEWSKQQEKLKYINMK
jgi:hypothetical protein